MHLPLCGCRNSPYIVLASRTITEWHDRAADKCAIPRQSLPTWWEFETDRSEWPPITKFAIRPPISSGGDGFCNRPGRSLLALEAVFDNFAVQRATADLENRRRLLLVPVHRLQHADDVGALGVGERGKPLAG